MMRNRKVWGVLGLLLALVVVVGYGQQPLGQQPYKLTVNRNCTRAADGKLELFVMDLDVHPSREITYQNDPSPNRPDNPVNCPGVAFFLTGWPDTVPPYYGGAIQLYIRNNPGFYKFKVCFRRLPPPPPTPPSLIITATASFPLPLWSASPTITSTPNCECISGPTPTGQIGGGDQWIKWKFELRNNSVEFCRVEAEVSYGLN